MCRGFGDENVRSDVKDTTIPMSQNFSAWQPASAQLVAADQDFDGAPLFRREFDLDQGHGEVVSAQLAASGFGVFEAFLNGTPVADDVLSPGWSSYEWRLRYRSYDVGRPLESRSVLGFAVGNGWFRGRLGFSGGRAFYGNELGVIAELEITFADGHRQTVVTDESWQAGPSAVLANDLYDGQTIDARRYDDTWMRPGEPPAGWGGVHALEFERGRLTPYVGPVVKRHEVLRPVEVWASPSGKALVDFGQNLVGWIRLTVTGEPGTTVTIRHAEVLEDGELGTRPLRDAQATDRFILSGATDVFEPTKTFHGFQYAEVTGIPLDQLAEAVEAVVVHSELTRTGRFECSDPMLNQLHQNVVWGLKGNFLDLPTDCPQRNERLGWTGDIAVFTPSAAFLYDVGGFLGDWLKDLAVEQSAADGRVPFVVPDVLKFEERRPEFPIPESTAIWSDAAVWVPWAIWQAYGDLDALREQYPAMAAHTRRVKTLLSPTGLWDTGFQFGDWLDPQAPPESPFEAKADNGVVATASLYRTARLAARAAVLVGQEADAAEFDKLADRVQAAFLEHYVRADGIIHSDCATVYALAIAFDLLDGRTRELAGDRLATLVADNGYRVSTGFAGTPYVTDALTSTGHLDVAYRLLLERECPSWLYPVTMGATTVWERWDSMLPDGTINPGEMTSFNHYALGSVADWMHRTIGGIAPLEPGYKRVLVAPQPGGGITWARTSLATARGEIEVSWQSESGELAVDVVVPSDTTALVRLPGTDDAEIGPGTHHLTGRSSKGVEADA